jgi:hypothetical protein
MTARSRPSTANDGAASSNTTRVGETETRKTQGDETEFSKAPHRPEAVSCGNGPRKRTTGTKRLAAVRASPLAHTEVSAVRGNGFLGDRRVHLRLIGDSSVARGSIFSRRPEVFGSL